MQQIFDVFTVNKKYIKEKVTQWTARLYSFVGVSGLFFPINNYFYNQGDGVDKIILSIVKIFLITLVFVLIVVACCYWKIKKTQSVPVDMERNIRNKGSIISVVGNSTEEIIGLFEYTKNPI